MIIDEIISVWVRLYVLCKSADSSVACYGHSISADKNIIR